jgi:hypothetical protein
VFHPLPHVFHLLRVSRPPRHAIVCLRAMLVRAIAYSHVTPARATACSHVTPVHVTGCSHAMPVPHVTVWPDAMPRVTRVPHATLAQHVKLAHSALVHCVLARFEPAQRPFSVRMPSPEPPAIPSLLSTSASFHSSKSFS